MKQNKIKNIANKIVAISFIILSITSCSSGDAEPELVFSSLTTSKTYTYIENSPILTFVGTGYDNVNVTSTNTLVTIVKKTETTYEIKASAETLATIKVELSNNSKKEFKTVQLYFFEHGVINSNTVEGIKINTDNVAKTLLLLGEPEYKTDSSDGLKEYWRYYSKGLALTIVKSSKIATQIEMFSSNYYYINSDNVKIYYTNYPYEIGNGWKINNTSTTMDMVVNKLGTPAIKRSSTSGSSINVYYQYTTQQIVFRFISDIEDNYTGKKIINYTIY